MNKSHTEIGLIAIGRNEGDRLAACLDAASGRVAVMIYVDSGSTDASLDTARARGAHVVELDTSAPFSAARARNAGLTKLRAVAPEARYVQFVDGDCALAEHWIDTAKAALDAESNLAIVCGRRREVAPEASIYNRLCDMEWDTPIGETKACGGDALMRLDALEAVGGFDPAVVAGEEPELCFRLRQRGWRIRRLDAEMTRHDAAMTHFSQWWRRAKRAGHAAAQALAMHGRSAERFGVRRTLSIWLWTLAPPLLTLITLGVVGPLGLLLLGVYPLQAMRLAIKEQGRGRAWRDSWLYASACLVGKFAEAQGQSLFAWRRMRRNQATLIEYKNLNSAERS